MFDSEGNTFKLSTESITSKLLEATDSEEVKKVLKLFNLTALKKQALAANKLYEIQDKVNEEALERVSQMPDEISNKDLISYMSAVQNQLKQVTEQISNIDNIPTIQSAQQINTVNINVETSSIATQITSMSKESREKTLKAIDQILMMAKEQAENTIIDADIVPKEDTHE